MSITHPSSSSQWAGRQAGLPVMGDQPRALCHSRCSTEAPLAFTMDFRSFHRVKVSFYLILLIQLFKITIPNHLPKQLLDDKLPARDLRYSKPKPVSET